MGIKEKADASTRGAAPLITFDGFLFEFHSALEAAQCAVEMQRALSKRNDDVPNCLRPPVARCAKRSKHFVFVFYSSAPGVVKNVREK